MQSFALKASSQIGRSEHPKLNSPNELGFFIVGGHDLSRSISHGGEFPRLIVYSLRAGLAEHLFHRLYLN